MARLIGMDEAGLGPNLGPLIVAVTVWEVPDTPQEFDFWKTFEPVLTNVPSSGDPRLHVADSKQIFQPQRGRGSLYRGIEKLERGVLSALKMLGLEPASCEQLRASLSSENPFLEDTRSALPWYADEPVSLPLEKYDFGIVESWRQCCEQQQVRLLTIKSAIIEPPQFNRLIREYDNKSLVVSRVAFQLLRSVWSPDETETFVVADKHGGRNRYDHLLAEVLDQEMIFRLKESAERSDYRVGKTLLRFQPRAEEHGPVALASMTAKYLRELAMYQFNRFWMKHVAGLEPTQGYPVDAKRFCQQIAATQLQLGISDDHLWRSR